MARPGRRALAWLAVVVLAGVCVWWLGSTLFVILAGFDDAPGEWAAIVYPDRTDRTKFDVTPRFKTFGYCRDAAVERMNAIQTAGGGDYECGYKCDLAGDPHRMNVCEKTRK
jgi:hypothetical protein